MKTPICDFVRRYVKEKKLRLHMPGHKGSGFLGVEALDLTEIEGADVLYSADGIIKESMGNASKLFRSGKTIYSTEGSSLSIRAMLYLCSLYAKEKGLKPVIAAGRNAHSTFMSASALIGFDVEWLISQEGVVGDISCKLSAEDVAMALDRMDTRPVAVYLTSPDYLGNVSNVLEISKVCKERGVILAVDNAHGAYLSFLDESMHPIDLGADICCDSAHKTLPVLTGGGYLHISKDAPKEFFLYAERAMSLFASTSPSYLILQSLDYANEYLAGEYRSKLNAFCNKIHKLKQDLLKKSVALVGDEPLKLTIDAVSMGYSGKEIADILSKNNIVCEFYDRHYVVLMLTPEISDDDLSKLILVLGDIPKRQVAVSVSRPVISVPKRIMSIREATLLPFEEVALEKARGRVLADPCVSCPPAIPIIACGELIGDSEVELLRYYGITTCKVVKNI